MSEGQAKPSGVPGWMRSRVGTMVTTAIVVAVAFALILVVMLSPSMSPLASIHDADGDGYADSVDDFPDDASEWNDLDGDGVGDNADAFPDDSSETSDSDSDGVGDNSDPFPTDASEWNDADDDGVGDNSDEFPYDPDECQDSDSDGVGDNSDAFPDDPTEWSDTDGDGWGDNTDVFPEDPDEDSPELLLYGELMSDYVLEEFMVVNPEFPWDDFKVTLSSGSEIIVWEPESEDLVDTVTVAHDYETFSIGDIDVFLSVTDVSGDGLVSAMDAFGIFVVDGSFASDIDYVLNCTYEPTGHVFKEFTFSFDLETPVSSLTRSPITNGCKFTFVAVTDEVSWNDVTVLLGDGTYFVSWSNITSDDLDDGIAVMHNYGVETLGTLEVTLVIVDLAGNGIVNGGDYFTLTAVSFSGATDYTVTLIYEPTDGQITTMTFTG